MKEELMKVVENLPELIKSEAISVGVDSTKSSFYSMLGNALQNGPIEKWKNYRYSKFSEQLADSILKEANPKVHESFFKRLAKDEDFSEFLYERARDVELSRSKEIGPKLMAVLTSIVGLREEIDYSNLDEANMYEMFREMNDKQLERSYIFFCELRRCYNEIIKKYEDEPSGYVRGNFYMWYESPENRLEGHFSSYDRLCMKVPEKIEYFTIELSSSEIYASGESWTDEYQEIDIMNISGKWAKILEDTGIIYKRVNIRTQSVSEDESGYTEPGNIKVTIEGEVKTFLKMLEVMDQVIEHDGVHRC
jgi:hypothetical protein